MIVVAPIERVPLTLVKFMPVEPLLDDDTLVNVMPRVVGLTTSAGPPAAEIEPVVTLTVPLPVAETPVPLLVVTVSDENEYAPVFVDRLTPVPEAELLSTVVVPKLKPPAAAVQFETSIPAPVTPDMFVVVIVNEPPTALSMTPWLELFVDSTVAKVDPVTIVPVVS